MGRRRDVDREKVIVTVVKTSGRRNWYLRHACPRTGKIITKSSGTPNRREAEREAALWEAELRVANPRKGVDRATWSYVREAYHDLHLVTLKNSSIVSAEVSLDRFEAWAGDGIHVDEIDHDLVERWKASMLREKLQPHSVRRNMTYLGGLLRWAVEQGYLAKMPRLPRKPRVPKSQRSRGRALTDAEFKEMVKAVDGVAAGGRIGDADEWKFYLRGLWLSGLRLDESLGLTWEPTASGHHLELDDSVMIIDAEDEKGNQDRTLPLTPDFVDFLAKVPKRDRSGRVFKLTKARGPGLVSSPDHVGARVSDIGEAAGILVDERLKKFASAQDLRKSFGTRWAQLVAPLVLKGLMRHESIQTTEAYYVGLNAKKTATDLRKLVES